MPLPKMSAARRRRLLASAGLLGGVGLVLAVASFISRLYFEQPSARGTAPILRGRTVLSAPTPVQPTLFRVSALEGRVVTLYREQWSLVAAGDHLSLQSVIRTYPDAKALLRRGGTEIEIRGGVDIRLSELANRTARFDLIRGMVSAAVPPEDTVEIGGHQMSTRNEGGARWVVSMGPKGRVDVATTEGRVGFEARGGKVTVPAGHQSTALAEAPPSEPKPIPPELLLSVFWPEPSRSAAPLVRGKTQATTRLKVNGAPVPVGEDGRWSAPVPVPVGDHPVSVQAEDIAGRRKTVESVIRRQPPAPVLESEKEDLWKP
jgi:Glucodextranase, domain B